MPCEHMGILLSRYVDGEASAEDRRVVEGHVRECGDCNQELETFRRNENLLAQAFSDGVAGESFISDVLTKAGVTRSRPGRVRLALNRAVRAATAFLAVPARAAAAILLGMSAFLAWNAYSVHRQNERLITEISNALGQMEGANRANRDLAQALQDLREDFRLATIPHEPTEREHVAENPEQPGPKQPEVAAVPPVVPPEPKVVAFGSTGLFHSVTAVSWEEGVKLTWETRGPTQGKVQFTVLRKATGDAQFGAPLNPAPLSKDLCYLDTTAVPGGTSYIYKIVGKPESGASEESSPIEVRTLGDLMIVNNGVVRASDKSYEKAIIEVRRWIGGRWASERILVGAGEPIGSGDSSTGCTLERIEEVDRTRMYPCVDFARDKAGNPLRDGSGGYLREFKEKPLSEKTNRILVIDEGKHEYPLWQGEGRRGTVGSLE